MQFHSSGESDSESALISKKKKGTSKKKKGTSKKKKGTSKKKKEISGSRNLASLEKEEELSPPLQSPTIRVQRRKSICFAEGCLYSNISHESMIHCNACASVYHCQCLGLDPHKSTFQTSLMDAWICPKCDLLPAKALKITSNEETFLGLFRREDLNSNSTVNSPSQFLHIQKSTGGSNWGKITKTLLVAKERSLGKQLRALKGYSSLQYQAELLRKTSQQEEIEAPKNPREAMKNPKWWKSMKKERDALIARLTWITQKLDPSKPCFRPMWVYRIKSDGTFKSRLTIDGSPQEIDSKQTYSPVGDKATLRLFFVQSLMDSTTKCYHLDISNAFVHGKLEEDEYVQMYPPPGFPEKDGEVLLIMRSLYGLKNSPKIWRDLLFSTLKKMGFKASEDCPSILLRADMLLYVYVDDIFVISTETQKEDLVRDLSEFFDIKDLGIVQRALGIEVNYVPNGIVLTQSDYLSKIVQAYSGNSQTLSSIPLHKLPKLTDNILNSDEQKLYQEILGSILYAANCTRPDLSHSIGLLAKFSQKACRSIMQSLLDVLDYIRGTLRVGLLLQKSSETSFLNDESESKELVKNCDFLRIDVSSDSDHASDSETRFSRYASCVWANGSLIDWQSKGCLQTVINLSSTEAELYAANYAAIRGVYLSRVAMELNHRKPLQEIELEIPRFNLFIDNGAAVHIIEKGDLFTVTLRHADIRVKWVIHCGINGTLKACKIKGENNAADLMTKIFARIRFAYLCNLMGLVRIGSAQEGNVGKYKSFASNVR